ncbi:MAG TPA: phosphate ABC transporter permease PstA [Hyphomicrobiales bacterium]|nr:phosphate ABC transporter permease PstA [Rhodobiaceae bacterium]HXK54812.1 phosphate ABC transporter permease PstA [Hyphomicrobiales bacterium]
MTDIAPTPARDIGPAADPSGFVRPEVSKRLSRRYAAETRFRIYGIAALTVATSFLVFLIATMIAGAWPALLQGTVTLQVEFDRDEIAPSGALDEAALRKANFEGIARNAIYGAFPQVTDRREKRDLGRLLGATAGDALRAALRADPALLGTTAAIALPLSDDAELLVKGLVDRGSAQKERRLSDREIAWLDALGAEGRLETRFNKGFFTNGDSREPERAGVWGAIVGSFLTLVVTLVLSFPLGVISAVYLEEFAPKNRWTEIIEVNINNLAAVPSIVFGLLGLAVFLNFFGLPRSAPLVGGMVLALMTLPTIIIATRAALVAVPPSIREAALGVGASQLQVVMHHVLPLATPGVLTGSIIGMARALGETAPLLMIGMVAFIVDIPGSLTDPATVLPVQIYIWADSPERAFVAKTGAATLVLLSFLLVMNALAIFLRKQFERRW